MSELPDPVVTITVAVPESKLGEIYKILAEFNGVKMGQDNSMFLTTDGTLQPISGGRFRRWRRYLGFNQGQMAEKLGISIKTVSNWENNGVSDRHLEEIWEIIGTDLTS